MLTVLRKVARASPVASPKYRNQKVTYQGETFDSKAELAVYQRLQLQERHGAIRNLTRQVSFVLAPGAIVAGRPKRALTYRCDFTWIRASDGQQVVADVKGVLTQAYIIKRHLMVTVHGIDILELK